MGLFDTLKKIVAVPVKLIITATRTPVGRAAAEILKPVYETVVPEPVQKIITKAVKLAPLAKLLKPKGASTMNQYETALRELADVVKAIQEKDGTVELIGEVVESLGAANAALQQFNTEPDIEVKRVMVREALDNTIGTEADALFGPTGSLVKFDIPFIDDETATDLALGPLVKLAIPDVTEEDTDDGD